jgi:hypothetical protein
MFMHGHYFILVIKLNPARKYWRPSELWRGYRKLFSIQIRTPYMRSNPHGFDWTRSDLIAPVYIPYTIRVAIDARRMAQRNVWHCTDMHPEIRNACMHDSSLCAHKISYCLFLYLADTANYGRIPARSQRNHLSVDWLDHWPRILLRPLSGKNRHANQQATNAGITSLANISMLPTAVTAILICGIYIIWRSLYTSSTSLHVGRWFLPAFIVTACSCQSIIVLFIWLFKTCYVGYTWS